MSKNITTDSRGYPSPVWYIHQSRKFTLEPNSVGVRAVAQRWRHPARSRSPRLSVPVHWMSPAVPRCGPSHSACMHSTLRSVVSDYVLLFDGNGVYLIALLVQRLSHFACIWDTYMYSWFNWKNLFSFEV